MPFFFIFPLPTSYFILYSLYFLLTLVTILGATILHILDTLVDVGM